MTLSFRYRAHSEIGLVRKNNQDSCYVSPTMLIVADGMGGAAAGDLASAVVIREMRAVDGHYEGEEMLDALETAVDRAADAIAALVETEPGLDGMGSTATGVLFDGTELGLVNIGDSRTYLFRDGTLYRLTHDHSWVQSLVDEGRITEEESLVHPHRSLILRVINGQPQHVPDLQLADVQEGDRLLICSDGLCGMVTDAVIERHMTGSLDAVMPVLIGLAHEQGGLDNISIILADVVEGPPEGTPQVYGAAALIDLDAPLETLSLELPDQEEDEDAEERAQRPTVLSAERARYAPTTRHRLSTRLKVAMAILIPLAVIVGGGWAWYSYTQQQYFVGADAGTVAIFRGIPDQTFNLPLSQVVQPSDTRVDDLPTYFRDQVQQTISVTSLETGQTTLAELQRQAQLCREQRAGQAIGTPVTPPSSPSPGQSGSALPLGPASGSPLAPATLPTPATQGPQPLPPDPQGCG